MLRKFVYVAVGCKYVQEARQSVESLKKYNTYPVCLITDKDPKDNIWDEVIVLNKPDISIKDKLEMYRCEADQVMFIDTDTYITDDLSEGFDLLNRFDIVAKHDWSGRNYRLDGIPESFPEFNTGVLLFRKNEIVKQFFKFWKYWFEEYKGEMGREMDQRSFRKAIFDFPNIKVFTLPPEYNQMNITLGAQTVYTKILHGRPFTALKLLDKEINKKPNMARVYMPDIGVFYSRNEWYVIDFFKKGFFLIWSGTYEFTKRIFRRS